MIKLNFTVYSPDYSTVITTFNQESLISLLWTRRFAEPGEFALTKPLDSFWDREMKLGQIVEGTGDGLGGAMVIEHINVHTVLGEGDTITISGRSLEIVLQHMAPRTVNPFYPLSGSINDITNRMLKACEAGKMVPYPIRYTGGSDFNEVPYFAKATIEDCIYGGIAPGDERLAISPLEIIMAMSNNPLKPFGFRLERQTDHLQLTLYRGIDRRNDILFSEAGGNLLSSEYTEDGEDTWNEVYATTGQNPGPVVTIPNDGVDHTKPNTAIYRADMYPNLDPADAYWQSSCKSIAEKYIRAHQPTADITCEIDPQKPRYGAAYDLGDVVSVYNGIKTLPVRVTEMTYAYSSSGEEYHPVLEYERGD